MSNENIVSGFRIEDMITVEERAIMYGGANGRTFDKKNINRQLNKARIVHKD